MNHLNFFIRLIYSATMMALYANHYEFALFSLGLYHALYIFLGKEIKEPTLPRIPYDVSLQQYLSICKEIYDRNYAGVDQTQQYSHLQYKLQNPDTIIIPRVLEKL